MYNYIYYVTRVLSQSGSSCDVLCDGEEGGRGKGTVGMGKPNVFTVFIGDDVSDEDAFKVLFTVLL